MKLSKKRAIASLTTALMSVTMLAPVVNDINTSVSVNPTGILQIIDADAASYSTGKYKINTSSGSNVRKGAGTGYKKVGAASNGTSFTVTKVNGSWGYTSSIKCTNGYKSGWVCLTYAKCTSSSNTAVNTNAKPSSCVITYSKSKNGNQKLSANFKVKEFACHDGSDTIKIDRQLVYYLQKIRDHYGKAVNINSGYRTPSYNKKVGGASNSYHMKGMAADIYISGISPQNLAAYAKSIGVKGVGTYRSQGFVHIDTRTSKYYWNG